MLEGKQCLNGRYQLLQCLAQNAGQQTWSAIDCRAEYRDRVVVKLLAMNPQMQWDQAKLLEREGLTLRKLNHPRIPKYRDYFVLDQVSGSRFPWFCLVQDQVPGKSLQQLLEEGVRFTEVEVEEIACEVLEILNYLHRFQPPILHRDIKPSNLIRGEDYCIYLIDFGAVQDQAALEGVTFTVVGTYGYAPMEQFGGRTVPASDLYALGMTLIHLLTGVSPADLPHSNGRVQFSDGVGVDRTLVNWVEQLTEPNLDSRLATAELALDTLQNRSKLSLPLLSRRPIGSTIQLKKSINQLTITIFSRRTKGLSWGYSGLAFITICTNILRMVDKWPWQLLSWQSSALLINLGFLIYFVILPIFSAYIRTVIFVHSTHFTISYQVFGFTYWKYHQKMTEILVDGKDNSSGQSVIHFHIDNKTFSTNPMASIEQKWLIQEIKDWIAVQLASGLVNPKITGGG